MESTATLQNDSNGASSPSAVAVAPENLRERLRRPVTHFRQFREWLMERVLLACGLLSSLFIALIFVFLFKEGIGALRMVPLHEFWSSERVEMRYDPATDSNIEIGRAQDYIWQPVGETPRLSIVPLVWGSLGIALVTAVLSTLIGIAVGIYLSEIASLKLRNYFKPALELLVGIPTVVIGFFMLAVLAQPLKNLAVSIGLGRFYSDTFNLFIGAVGVSFVIIPVIASLVDDALRAVPNDLRAASLSLGATRWQTTWRVVLPAAVSGVFAAVILGFGRALGETMIVLMCAGNAPQLTANPFGAVRTITATIAAEMGAAPLGSVHAHTLFLLGALLVTITFVMNIIVEVILNRYRRKIRF